jgi:hypothetical protein
MVEKHVVFETQKSHLKKRGRPFGSVTKKKNTIEKEFTGY